MIYDNDITRTVIYDNIEKFILGKTLEYHIFIGLIEDAKDEQLKRILSAFIPYCSNINELCRYRYISPITFFIDLYKIHKNNQIVIKTIINLKEYIFDHIYDYRNDYYYDKEIYCLIKELSQSDNVDILKLLTTYKYENKYLYRYSLDSLCENPSDYIMSYFSSKTKIFKKFTETCWIFLSKNINIKAIELMMIYLTNKEVLNNLITNIKYSYDDLKRSKSQLHIELNKYFMNPHNIIKKLRDIM